MKKCCIRWKYILGHQITLAVSRYKYTFDKMKYCSECGEALSSIGQSRDMKKLTQGYALAVSVLIQTHGEGTEVDDVIKDGGLTLKECKEAGVDRYDMKYLRPSLKRIESEG